MDRRRLLAVLCAVIVGWSLTVGGLAAQEPEPTPGELVLPSDSGVTLSGVSAPASGALFVVGQDANKGLRLLRSDDGGDTWRPVSLPPPAGPEQPQVLTIDPINHATLYATGAEGLYKSEDDAASWRPLLPIAEPTVAVAVSPADPKLVYLGLRTEKLLRLLRSQDGGESWETVYRHEPKESECRGGLLIAPHPTDASRVSANVDCDWRVDGDLYQSRDRGTTWEAFLTQGEKNVSGYPIALAGGSGAAPERLYAGFRGHYVKERWLHLDLPIYRSDDDGKTWRHRVIVPLEVSGPKSQERNYNVLTAVVADPAETDRVYVGLMTSSSRPVGALQSSTDGGTSWKRLDVGEAKHVLGVALGVDRQNLYAATDLGLYRLRLR